MPPHKNLKLYNLSHRADDKSSNLVFSGLSVPFKGAATALMLGTTIALSALPANAQEAPKVQQVASVSIAPNQVEGITQEEINQASMEAGQYSIENPVISYLVVGRTDRYSSNQLRGGFASMFTGEKNPHTVEFTDLKSFGVAEKKDGARIGFYIDGVQFGPYDFLEAVDQVPELSRKYLEHKPVHERRLAEEQRLTSPTTSVSTASLTTAYE